MYVPVEVEQAAADRARYVRTIRQSGPVNPGSTQIELMRGVNRRSDPRHTLIVVEIEPSSRDISDVRREEPSCHRSAAIGVVDGKIHITRHGTRRAKLENCLDPPDRDPREVDRGSDCGAGHRVVVNARQAVLGVPR